MNCRKSLLQFKRSSSKPFSCLPYDYSIPFFKFTASSPAEFGNAYGFSFTHFAQNDLDSRPEVINDTFANGVNWLTYMGHGSGTSWASTNITYTVKDIKDMNNAKVNKPVFIDVACMNGKIEKGYAGERLMNEVDGNGDPIGTTMYYGGTVNISWHPPAIMAKGMAIKTVIQGLTNISEIIFAGQLYLSENYNDQTGIVDNFEWMY